MKKILIKLLLLAVSTALFASLVSCSDVLSKLPFGNVGSDNGDVTQNGGEESDVNYEIYRI